MARPKKPEDPRLYPDQCVRCSRHYQTGAIWDEGRICIYCYRAAMRVMGTCACGHVGVLPGLIGGAPACRGCSGVRLNVDCRRCGAEAELYRDHLCQRCVLADHIDDALTDPRTGRIAAVLMPVANGLKAMERANSGLVWIRQDHVDQFLRSLAASTAITHEAVDNLPAGATRDYVRGLLVEYAVLPRRDEMRLRFDDWAAGALQRVSSPEHRDVAARYVRWHHQRRMRQQTPTAQGTFLRAKQSTTVAIEFLNWLTDHGTVLAEASQGQLDTWLADGPSTRLVVDRFLAWCRSVRLVPPTLRVPRHRRGTATRMAAADQASAIDTVVHTQTLAPRDRFAAVLVLVFGQTMQRVVTLTWDDIQLADVVTLTLADTPIVLESPLDHLVLDLVAEPGSARTAGHPNSRWVFAGGRPGTHLSAGHLRNRLKPTFSTLAARLGTLSELAALAPIAILAETLGYQAATLERHAVAGAVNYQRYVDLAR